MQSCTHLVPLNPDTFASSEIYRSDIHFYLKWTQDSSWAAIPSHLLAHYVSESEGKGGEKRMPLQILTLEIVWHNHIAANKCACVNNNVSHGNIINTHNCWTHSHVLRAESRVVVFSKLIGTVRACLRAWLCCFYFFSVFFFPFWRGEISHLLFNGDGDLEQPMWIVFVFYWKSSPFPENKKILSCFYLG